jgi:hypothetical protein
VNDKIDWFSKRKIKEKNEKGEFVEKNYYPGFSFNITFVKRVNYNLTELTMITCIFFLKLKLVVNANITNSGKNKDFLIKNLAPLRAKSTFK